jgi:Na+/proline symporter
MILRGTGTTVEALTRGAVPANVVILVSTAVFATYGSLGGLVAAVSTKLLQSLMMLILSLLVLPFAVASFGGLGSLHARLGDAAFALVSSTSEVTFFFVVMVTINGLVGIVAMPHHMAIGGAGKSEISCRTGWTYGNVMKRFVTLAWAFTGVYAVAMFPGIAPAAREQAFGVILLNLLPAGLIGLMIAAMLASLMAVCDAYMVDGAALFTRNVYSRFAPATGDDRGQMKVARYSSFGVVAAGIVVALLLSDVVSGLAIVWKIMAFLGIPFWMAVFWRRGNRYGLWTSVVVTTSLSLYTNALGWGLADQISLYLPAGVISFVIASLLTKQESEERLHAFYTLLHTPVGEEARLAQAGVKSIMEGSVAGPAGQEAGRSLEEQGHGLLLVDLLSLHRTFSFRRYRVDLLGFLAAAAMITAIIALAMLLSWIATGRLS